MGMAPGGWLWLSEVLKYPEILLLLPKGEVEEGVYTSPPNLPCAVASSLQQPWGAKCLDRDQGLQELFWAPLLSCWAEPSNAQLTAWLQIKYCHTCPAGAASRTTGTSKFHQDPWKMVIVFLPIVGGHSNKTGAWTIRSLKPHVLDNRWRQSSRSSGLEFWPSSSLSNSTIAKCVF